MYLEEARGLPLEETLAHMQSRLVTESTYFGIQAIKNPLDFWIYQELIYRTRPQVIVEIGNHHGGHLLALAHLCDALGYGQVIGVDLERPDALAQVGEHPRIELVTGDAQEQAVSVEEIVSGRSVLIIEDSSHTYSNTLGVLRAYSPLVKSGGYFIVEDGIIDLRDQVVGPLKAIEDFLEEHPEWSSDRTQEGFLITWNPKGFLVRR